MKRLLLGITVLGTLLATAPVDAENDTCALAEMDEMKAIAAKSATKRKMCCIIYPPWIRVWGIPRLLAMDAAKPLR